MKIHNTFDNRLESARNVLLLSDDRGALLLQALLALVRESPRVREEEAPPAQEVVAAATVRLTTRAVIDAMSQGKRPVIVRMAGRRADVHTGETFVVTSLDGNEAILDRPWPGFGGAKKRSLRLPCAHAVIVSYEEA